MYHGAAIRQRWGTFGLFEQLGNVGSEVHRAAQWKDEDREIARNSLYRALELLDFSIQDPRWKNGLKELVRVREFLVDAFDGGKEYGNTLEDLDRYFFQFALAARKDR